MAGGRYAESTMCPQCLARADRVTEGVEDDYYACPSCGTRFGIDWSHGQPKTPCWPPTKEQIEQAREVRKRADG